MDERLMQVARKLKRVARIEGKVARKMAEVARIRVKVARKRKEALKKEAIRISESLFFI